MPTQSALRQQMFGLRDGIPDWHHPKSRQMQLEKADDSCVVIMAPAARLEIIEMLDAETIHKWIVRWEIFFREERGTRGEIVMTASQLCAAFALNERSEGSDHWLANSYQEIASLEGMYFRYDRWLNIPGPGTGKDGDPNISVCLTDDMKKSITDMVLEAEEQNDRQLSFDF